MYIVEHQCNSKSLIAVFLYFDHNAQTKILNLNVEIGVSKLKITGVPAADAVPRFTFAAENQLETQCNLDCRVLYKCS